MKRVPSVINAFFLISNFLRSNVVKACSHIQLNENIATTDAANGNKNEREKRTMKRDSKYVTALSFLTFSHEEKLLMLV